MADNNEEEYLDALLKSMLNGDEGDDGLTASSLPIDEEFGISEDDDMMMLSKMLLDDNDISYDDEEDEDTPAIPIPEIEHSEMESFLSLDDLLSTATNNAPGAIGVPEEENVEELIEEPMEDAIDALVEEPVEEVQEEPEITPIVSDNIDPFAEFDFEDEEVAFTDLESLMHVELANISGESGESSGVVSEEAQEEPAEEDFFGDFDEISSMFSNESSSVNEEELRRAMIEGDEGVVHDDALEKELADILALDEGMSIADIPDVQPDSMLTEEEKMKVQGIEMPSEEVTEDEGKKNKKAKKAKKEKEPKPKKEKKTKKEKKAENTETAETVEIAESSEKVEKVKKAEKSEKPKKDKAAKAEKPKKEKTKFSLKEFFAKFNDDDEEEKPKTQADNNQKLIDELYKGKESLDDEDVDEEGYKKGKKKDKKAKTPKPKKEKQPKVKDPSSQEKIKVGKFGGFIIVLLVIVFLFGGFYGVRFINYQLTINSSHKYFEMGNYDLAYDKLSGIDIMKKDSEFYNGVRTVMIVYQGYTSYNNYVEIDREAEALDALINAVGRKQQVESDAILYDVTKEVNIAYEQILNILEFYGIDERVALDLYKMTDYGAYYEILHSYEGVAK